MHIVFLLPTFVSTRSVLNASILFYPPRINKVVFVGSTLKWCCLLGPSSLEKCQVIIVRSVRFISQSEPWSFGLGSFLAIWSVHIMSHGSNQRLVNKTSTQCDVISPASTC
ncbi:hypothetical protein ATANTOWER_029451 [Ataeniobius toweri]|uniref:Secreted protein n=1 Tax=Ataeniobius toweri TaxID=208326 RepID=A0ABU7ART8_9TELE|nr:hypothetical protein [Ataeniobius toweri]